MNNMYDAVMKMEQLLGVYEKLIEDLAAYMKENGIDYTGDNSVHPAIMLYSEAGRIYSRLLSTRRMEDLLYKEGNRTSNSREKDKEGIRHVIKRRRSL